LIGRVVVLDVSRLSHPCLVEDDWAMRVLDRWIASVAEVADEEMMIDSGTNIDGLREHEHQTQAVIARITGKPAQALIVPHGYVINLRSGVAAVQYARGILVTGAETRAHLGSTAPVMAADGLHPSVWGAAQSLWADGHHGQAVQRAATFINADVQDRIGRTDISDSDLMAQAFSLDAPAPGKARLRWPGKEDDQTVRSMRTGILNFSQGCFKAIRNPATHGTEELPMQICLEHLATLSTLARWIEECEVISAD
jgi:Protein of unknown function (Hypoth_ymh)